MQKASIIRASTWSVVAEISAKVAGPISFLLLAKLLTPADFGIIAAANSILGFTNVLADMGISKVIIQKDGTPDFNKKLENAGLWLNVSLGLLFTLLIIIFSENLADIFGQPHAALLIAVLGVQVLLFSFSSVQMALLRKRMQFKTLFYIRLVYITVPLAVSLPLAFAGAGYWSIAVGQLVSAAGILVMLWGRKGVRSALNVDFKMLRFILPDSSWVTLELVAVWALIVADAFFIGRLMSPAALGVYSIARTLFYAAITLSLGAIMPVIFSYFSKIGDINMLKKDVLLTQRFSFMLAGFMGVAMFLFAPVMQQVFFSDGWQGVATTTGIIFLLMGSSYFTFSIVEALKSRGHFRLLSINTVVSVLLSLPVLYFSVSGGLVIYVLIRCLLLFLTYPLIFSLSQRHLSISFADSVYNCRYIVASVCLLPLLKILFLVYLSNQVLIYIVCLVAVLIALMVNLNLEKSTLRKFVPKNLTRT